MSGPAAPGVAPVVSPASAAVAVAAPQQNGLFTRMGKGLKGMLGMAGGRRRGRKATRKGRKATRKGRKATRRRRVTRGGGGVCRSC